MNCYLFQLQRGGSYCKAKCTKPKRKRDETLCNDICLLVQAQAALDKLCKEEEIAFMADQDLPDVQTSQDLSSLTNLLIKPMIGCLWTLIVMNLIQQNCSLGPISQRIWISALMRYTYQDNLNCDLFNQSEQIMTSSEQSNDVSQSETDMISDSNIIPYSQYLSETQQETVQNSNSHAQQGQS
ncbi:hypothetical protein Tco_1190014 [Tanacetum coccineum]